MGGMMTMKGEQRPIALHLGKLLDREVHMCRSLASTYNTAFLRHSSETDCAHHKEYRHPSVLVEDFLNPLHAK